MYMNALKYSTKKSVILLNTGTDNSLVKLSIREKVKYPPFGLLSLEAFLVAHGYNVKVIDLFSNHTTFNDFQKEIHCFEQPPIAFGISTYTENFELSKNLIRIIKTDFPGSKIIMGGPHVSFLPEEAFEFGVDFVVLFEGESTFITLLEHIIYPQYLPLELISGISYRIGKTIYTNSKRNFIKNLDYLPVKLDFYKFSETSPMLYFITSRGCPGRCIFCASNSYSGRKYRAHTAEWIFSFIYFHYVNHGINIVNFVDDTFTINLKRLRKIFEYLNYAKLKINWEARCRIDQLSEEFILLIKSYGCISLHLGIESADQNVLDSINKDFRLEDFFENFKNLVKCGIKPRCSFIIGHHSDTQESIEKTLLLAYKIEESNLGVIAVGISTPLPGTYLLNNKDRLEINIKTTKWKNYTLTKPIYSTKKFTIDDIRKAYFIFYNDAKKLEDERAGASSDLKEFRAYLNSWVNEMIAIRKNSTWTG